MAMSSLITFTEVEETSPEDAQCSSLVWATGWLAWKSGLGWKLSCIPVSLLESVDVMGPAASTSYQPWPPHDNALSPTTVSAGKSALP